MTKLGLSTAKLIETQNGFLVIYMNSGSFLTGEQWFPDEQDAREFCRARELNILSASYHN